MRLALSSSWHMNVMLFSGARIHIVVSLHSEDFSTLLESFAACGALRHIGHEPASTTVHHHLIMIGQHMSSYSMQDLSCKIAG